MVAIVSGNSLGLSLTSLATLGQRGTLGTAGQGRNGEQAFVNIATGNLVLQDFDDRLEGRGLDIGAVRTYNSQGLLNDDNGDNWRVGVFGQQIQLSGTAGSASSVLTRTDRDGAESAYTWDSTRNLYVSSAGSGAFDTIAYDATAGRFTWTDGTTGMVERYESSGQGRLLSATDPSGNTVTLAYNTNGTPQSFTNANGEITYFDYVGANLAQIRTLTAIGKTVTRAHYAYDASNRLSSVTVDLSPEDGSTADGAKYVTTYTYDGASNRIASVTQTDGSSLAFTYVQVGADYKVATVKDGEGNTTSYSYDTANRRTSVTDSQGRVSTYTYDASGQLLQIKAPAVNGITQTTSFAYNANGDLIQIVDGEGHAVDMQYDGNGNQTLQRDAAGNTITRTYDLHNQLLTETVHLIPDPDGLGLPPPAQLLTTRYVYEGTGRNLLRFVLSPEGRVTEYRYDSYGQRVSSLQYGSGTFDVSAMSPVATPSESQMVSWVGGENRTLASRTDIVYSARGQVQQISVFSKVDASGNGIADGSESVTHYVYDRAGQLLSTVSATDGTTQYTYDGMGRQLSVQDALNNVTVTSYDDAGNKTTVTRANGLVTTSAYDRNGRLVSVQQGSTSTPLLSKTTYVYNAGESRPYQTIDATGAVMWAVYDAMGRINAEVSASGRVTEYVYNQNNQLVETIVYATPSPGLTTALQNLATTHVPVVFANFRPAKSSADQHAWRIYDNAGRAVRTIDASGAVTDTAYDDASRVTSITRYAGRIDTSNLGSTPALAATKPPLDPAKDRVTRNFYDADGLLRATLDAEGYLSELRYDGAGRLIGQTSYATPTDPALRGTGLLAQLVPAANASDQKSYWLHDAQGRTVAEIDAEGYLTERVYDANGNVTQTVRYATRVNATLLAQISAATTVADIRPSSTPEDRSTVVVYDKLNRVSQQTNYEGTVTQYAYDSVGNLISTTTAAGTSEARTLSARYDIQGRLTGELSGVGSALLVGGQTQAQIDAIWAQYGLTHAYDAAGRRVSTTDAYGNKTLFFYDLDGRLTHTVNALGEVAEQQYNTLGQLTASIQYGSRISVAGLSGGLVTVSLTNAINAIANNALDSRQSFTYLAGGQLSTSTDALGNVTQRTYNAFGEEESRDQAIGDGRHLVQTQTLDRRGLVVGTVTDASGVNAITSAVYDAFGRATRIVDANGNARTQTYDRLGRVVVTVDPLNAQRSTSYDAFGRVLTQTDALGNTTTYSYDKVLRSVSVTTPENITVTTVHTRHGQTQRVIDGNGNTTSFSYDKSGNLLTTTTPLTTTSSAFDRSNRLVQTTDANGNIVAFTYDAANRLLKRTVDPDGLNLVTEYAYDAKGQQISVTDANGKLTQMVYDLKGQLLRQVLDPAGLNLVTEYTYDARGKTLSVLSPGGTLTKYAYDNLGRRIEERLDPNGLNLRRTYAYDKNGNLTSDTDANGNVRRYVYDADDRLVFTFDALGNLKRNDYDAEGRIVRTVAYATPIDTTGLGAAPTLQQIASRVPSEAGGASTERRVFDKDGRLVATISGDGDLVTFSYDANGKVVERVAYATRVPVQGWTPGTLPAPVPDAAHDQRVRFVYDQLGRTIYTVDGTGAVVQQSYDGNGNVLERIGYATPIPVSTPGSAAAIADAIAGIANATRDAHDRFVYDRAGRLTWHADGAGAVTQQVYDKNGNLIKQIQYATAISSSALPSSVAPSAGDRITDKVYDAANRLSYSIDALGTLSSISYDKNGNVLMRWTLASRLAPPTINSQPTSAQIKSSASPNLGADRVERAAYDVAGRMVISIDPTGAATEITYDGVGNRIRTVQYATRLDSSKAPPFIPGYADVRSLANSQLDRVTSSTFDASNRLQYTVDSLGHVTYNSYDGLGRLTQSTAYALAIPAGERGTSAAIAAAIVTHPEDRSNSFSYDAAGRLLRSTDALGFVESYGYNALGQKISFTNKKGSTWTYDYDAAGRLTQETAPAVDMTAVTTDATGNLVVDGAHSGSTPLVTRMAYDALGNLLSRTEALGRPEQRTTSYQYDTVGHQVKVIFPEVGVYADNPANAALGGRTEVLKALFTETRYDAFGNAVSNLDVAGNMSYKTYDVLGQVRYEVDALGFVTGYQRNAWGQVTELVRFANATGLTSGSPTSLSTTQVSAAVNAAGIDHGSDRILTTEYDQAGRVSKVIEPQTFSYDAGAADAVKYFTAGKTTVNRYNAFGNLTQMAELKNAQTQEWIRTNNYYDLRGQKIATVDALGYLTTEAFDGAGNMVLHKEYATAIAGWNANAASATPPVAPGSNDDRATLYTYDLGGRKTAETRLSVEYSGSANGTYSRADIVTGYGYDAVGNLTRTTDANGASTYSYYDALGRVRAVAAPVRIAGGTALTPVTEFLRDAYGNAVVTIARSAGAASANDTSYMLAGANAADRATFAAYDRMGHVTQSMDANGVNRYSSYDAQGHVAKEWQLVTDGNGVSSTMFRVYQYDKLGQQTHIFDPASTSQLNGSTITTVSQAQAGLVDTAVTYNAFGEVTRKSVNGVEGEYFDYDNAGHIWRTNSGDGVDKVAFYNLQGKQTAQLTSYGAAYENLNLRSFQRPDELAWRAVRRTDTVYDALGHVTQTVGPNRDELNTGPKSSRTYTSAIIGSSSHKTTGESTDTVSWEGTNSVTLSWSALHGLGAGDVKVVMEYATQTWIVGGGTNNDESTNPLPTNPQSVAGGELRSRTQIISNAPDGSDSVTLTWQDPVASNGGISRVTRLTLYKKDLYGNWQQISDQSALGYASQVIDIDTPDDPSSTVQLQIRPAGSSGDSGWASVGLTNFGNVLRFNAAGLPAGNYEYRALMTTAIGVTTQIGSGRIDLTSPPLQSIDTPMGFYQTGVTGLGLFTWQSPGSGIDQVFRIRPAGSTGAWDTRVVSSRGEGKDGVDLSLIAAGTYDYELLWVRSGEGVPYAHATGQVVSTGFQPPRWVPPVNLPVIPGVEVATVTVGPGGDHDESSNSGPTTTKTVIRWPATNLGPTESMSFRYRLQGSGEWLTLPIGGNVSYDESIIKGNREVDIGGLAPGNYEYQVLVTQNVLGTENPVAQATGKLVVSPTSEGHNVPTLTPFPKPVTITPDDPANHIIGWTGSGPTYGPPVVIGTDANGQPIFGQGYGRDIISGGDESGPVVYGPVKAIPYYTYEAVQVTQMVPVQVAVGRDPVPERDEAGNIITTPVYETRTGTQTVPVQVQVGTDPIYDRDEAGNIIYETIYETQYQQRTVPAYGWVQVPRVEAYQVAVQGPPIVAYYDEGNPIYQRDMWGNIQYSTVYETRYRTVYDWVIVQTGWQQETYAVQVPVQRPRIIGYQPRYETQYVQVPYTYQVQVGSTPVYKRDAAGEIIYETRYETQMQPQTVWVQVPKLVTPPDPSQFIISEHSGSPIYGPPVMVPTSNGNESGPATTLGKGYEIVNGVVTAVPYVEIQTEWRWVDVWVPGTTPAPTVTDTTPPYTPGYVIPPLPPLFAATVTTAPGSSAVSENNTAGAPGSQAIWQDSSSGSPRPVVNQNTDRWGNVISISDPRSAGWVTTYRYNANNQLVEQRQPDANGTGEAVTQLFYDKLGRQVAVKDANGNVQGKVYDAGGNLVQELNADGGTITHSYNAFGEKMSTVDAEGRSTGFTYDNVGRLLTTTRMAADIWGWATSFGPSVIGTAQIVETVTWDQAGRKLSQTNGAGETIRYAYDLRGNLVSTTQPLGQVKRAAFDSMNRKIAEVDANGALATWSYNYFGQLTGHTDIGGATYSYSYDNARQLTQQTNSRGQNLSYSYDKAGQLLRIDDAGVGKVTTYAYDLGGRRIRETTVQGGVTYQDNQMAYDALGRLRWVADTNAYITIDYDKVGNRTHIHTKLAYSALTAQGPQGTPIEGGEETDRYFAYDQMNRQTLVDSATADGSVLGAEGHRLSYDKNGNRTRDEHAGVRIVQDNGQWTAVAGNIVEEYSYDNLNRLSTVKRDGALVEARGYDGASRVIQSTPGALGADYVNLHRMLRGTNGTDALQGRFSQYDANGRLVHQATAEYLVSASAVNYTYDNEGNALSYLVADTVNGTFTTTTNTVDKAEGYRTSASVSLTTKAGTGALVSQGIMGYNYDANGHLKSTGDVGQTAQPDLRTHNFINDANGNALYAYYAYEGTPDKRVNGQRQMVVNGEVLGRYGLLSDTRFDGTPLAQNGPFFTPQSDFSFGYQPINGNYPAGTPGSYSVGVSDTLQTIAKGAYGDSSLWYLIADANGLSGNADLRAGQVLRIPAATSSANNANTFKPYDPSKIANDSPTMMATPQSQGGGCGAIGQIIMVVVAVVVTIFTAGAAAPYLGATVTAGTTTFGAGLAALGGTYGAGVAVAAGAIGGAAGSIASQGVGIAIGAQDSFNWKGVALSAISGGISGGLGAVANGAVPALQGLAGNGLGVTLTRAALGNAISQGIGVAVGLQDKFSWQGVAAAAVGAGVGWGVNQALSGDVLPAGQAGPVRPAAFSGLGEFGGAVARGAVSGFAAGVTTAAMRGGRISAAQVAADAFGNALGDSLAAANSGIPGPVSADERSRILGYFADAPSTSGSTAAARQNYGFSMAAEQRLQTGQTVSDGYGPVNSFDPTADSLRIRIGDPNSEQRIADRRQAEDRRARVDELQRNIDELKSIREQTDSTKMQRLDGPTLPMITVTASREDDGSYDISEAAQLSNYPAPNSAGTGTITNLPPTFWERTWLSPEVQHVMGNSITGKLVGGLAHAGGTAWASFVSRDGYNPATGKNLNLVQQRDGRIDTLINAAATVVTGGASTATRVELQAMKAGVSQAEIATATAARQSMRERVLANIEATRAGNASSQFEYYATVEKLLDKRIELGLTSNAKMQRNFAYSEYQINGDIGGDFALSGKSTPKGTIGVPERRMFSTMEVGWDRAYDTEVKLFESIAQRYNPQRLAVVPDVSGSVNLHSELIVCYSCSRVVGQFQEMFPNINVFVKSGANASKAFFN
ncbi:deaminase domain-containing protein [Variovorax sp. 160MFSha2.1]|uniref:deaminase domain-containing protein n=1 Tax=Variovorax sp. 160MFSha2.1 TaxID=3158367 RepID=UPI003AAC3E05